MTNDLIGVILNSKNIFIPRCLFNFDIMIITRRVTNVACENDEG